jgi:opacity protein-like surface antigen
MRTVVRVLVVALVAAAVGALMPGPADAQGFTTIRSGGRGGTWDFYLPLTYADSAVISGQNGSSVDVNAGFGFGFGFGYNFNDNLHLNGLFTWNSRSYDALAVRPDGSTAQYSNYMYTSTFMLNAVYYFMEGSFTPFVTGGAGITYVDTNIQDGPTTGTCWYDPWWGYICSSYAPTKTENDVSYSAGLGVRYDLNRQFSLQGSYNKTWIDFSKASTQPDFDLWRLDIIFRM